MPLPGPVNLGLISDLLGRDGAANPGVMAPRRPNHDEDQVVGEARQDLVATATTRSLFSHVGGPARTTMCAIADKGTTLFL
jgi:hypothetical protein